MKKSPVTLRFHRDDWEQFIHDSRSREQVIRREIEIDLEEIARG